MKKVFLVSLLLSALTVSKVNAEETEVGLSILTPGGLNFVVKGELFGLPLQTSVGYLGRGDTSLYGLEVGYNFIKNPDKFFRSAQFITGHSDIDDDKWTYGGVSATFQYGGLFVEPGLTVGSGDYSSPQITMQVGWLWGL